MEQIKESNLNKPITSKFLLTFTMPTILSFVIMGIFGTIDGVFAARGISQEALGAINFVMPFFTFTMAIGAMLSMGGSALVAKKKGGKLHQEARENFTLLTLVTFATSTIISGGSWLFRRPLLQLLGTSADVFDLAMEYLQPLILMMPFIMAGLFLVQLLIAEGRPMLSMFASSSGAVVSTALNAVFIFVFDMGVLGLALATGIGYAVPAIVGVSYFALNRKGTIFFVRPKWDIKALGRSSLNGISEMVTMMATTVTTIVMNNVLVHIVGWEGVAAAGIILAAQTIFSSLYFGYSAGIAPVVSYNFGKKRRYGTEGELRQERQDNLQMLYKKSLVIVAALSVIALIGTQVFADLLVRIYVSPNDPFMGHLHEMAVRGLRIASTGFVLMGFNVFATAWFTAFNDGLVSGFMSLMRTMVFTLVLLVTLPRVWGIDGAWFALPLAEVLSITVTVFFLVRMGRKYSYRAGHRQEKTLSAAHGGSPLTSGEG
ncbi:MAG: MATE family efflux transporter [Oscillospiraceae bacterium]|nr:MATE family efflux transporter [Oscillospiraceae bacterium]